MQQPALPEAASLIVSSSTASGFKRGTSEVNGFGWQDLIGSVQPKTSGANTPTLAAFRGNIRAFNFAANDLIDFVFHMPHDWAVGTDLFFHVHWGHNGTNISGSFVFDIYSSFARGFNQATHGDFIADVNSTLTIGSLAVATTPQYRHRVDEIRLTASGGGAGLLDTDSLETDGLLLIAGKMTTIPTITGGTAKPFIFTCDIHYQSTGLATVNKAPSFY